MNENLNYDVLSLFAGGGFLDLGFQKENFSIAEAVEIEPWFIKGYNFAFEKITGEANLISSPIDLSSDVELRELGKKHKGITGIIGGPPCQDFSVGGKNEGITGERGKLIYSYLKIVKKIKPKFLFFENVPGLIETKEHKEEFLKFVDKIKKCGYVVWYDILNVLEYGFPQDRPRLVLVAFQKNIIAKLKANDYILETRNNILWKGNNKKYIFNWPTKKYPGIKDAEWPTMCPFGTLKRAPRKLKKYKEVFVCEAFKDLSPKVQNQNESFNPKSSKFDIIQEGDTNRKSFKRLHRYRYSPTVAYGHNEVHLHPTEPRRLTVREGLRLQTVPDYYIWPDTIPLTHKFKMISNGVPTEKARLVAREIKRTLDIYYNLSSES